MASFVKHFIALSVILAFTSASPILVPSGKELVYNYQAKIEAGTYKPAFYVSHFLLEGKLHMQNDKNSILMKFSDLKYKLYNGEKQKHESMFIISDQEINDISNVFRIEYKNNGFIKSLGTDAQDGKHALHFKKNMASIMQLDLNKLKLDSKSPHTFITEEDNLYGEGIMRYNVIPKGNEIIIDKMLEVQKSKTWYSYLGITSDIDLEQLLYKGLISADSHKKYNIIKDNDNIYIKQVMTHGAIYLHPMQGLSECHFLAVNQSLHLKEILPIQKQFSVNQEELTNELSFKLDTDMETEVMIDLSFGRYKMNIDEYINITYHILEEALTYLDEYHLTTTSPDFKKSQSINRLHRIMGQLNSEALEKIFASLKQSNSDRDKKIFKIFLEMIPLIGTRATTILVRNLIKGNEVDEHTAIFMLNKLPSHLRMPSIKLLTEVDDLMNLKNVSSSIHQAAVLNFARLIRKVYTHDSLQNQQNSKGMQEDLLEKYILKYVEHLKSSNDYYLQSLYMNSLYNIRMGNVVKHLEPYVKGEVENTNRHLRYLAMCASFSEVIKDEEKVFEVYWPILTDPTLHLELRAGAYITIMYTKLTMGKLWDIHWFMETEENVELYNLHYTVISSLASTSNPSLQSYKTLATQILNYMRKPYGKYLSRNYVIDYTDPIYGFGAMTNAMFLSTNTYKSLYMEFSSHLFSLPVSNYALWFKIDGIDKSLINKLEQIKKIHIDIYEIEQIIKIINSFNYQKHLHIECAFLQNDQIINFGYYNNSTIKKFVKDLEYLLDIIMIKDSIHISYEFMTQLVMPNDIGFPTLLQIKIPSVSNNRMLYSADIKDEIIVKYGDLQIQKSIQSMYDIGFYNPVSNLWQGIKRIQSYDLSIPLNYKYTTPKSFGIKFSLLRHKNETNDAIGLRNYITTFTYVFGDFENVLEKSSKNSPHYTQVSNGLPYRKKKIIFEIDDENTGLKYQIISFDSEQHISRQVILNLLNKLYDQNIKTHSVQELLVTIRNIWSHLIVFPNAGTFGLIIKAEPSKLYPVASIDISFRYHQEINRDKNMYLPSTKINTRATYSLKSIEDKTTKTWDLNALLDTNSGHTINNFKLHVTKIIPNEKDFKICLEGVKEWTKKTVKTQANITIGYTEDKQCSDSKVLIVANIRGKQSDEQLNMINNETTYNDCISAHVYEPIMRDIKSVYLQNLKCIEKITSLTNYLYNITITGPSNKTLDEQHIIDYIHGLYFPYYSYNILKKPMKKDNIIIINEYSGSENEMNVELMKNEDNYKLTEIPIGYLSLLGFYAESYHIPKKYHVFYKLGLLKSCFITGNKILNDNNEIIPIINSGWTELVATNIDMLPNKTLSVLMKRTGESKNLALRVNMAEQNLEIISNEDGFKIALNGTPLIITEEDFYQESGFSLGILKKSHQTIVLYTFQYGLYIIFSGNTIQMNIPLFDENLSGFCFIE